ncbi:Transposase DDE domain group 1 [Azospirillum sp. RU38E]|nr:Transposase DDE domain group 1 [Azospirillum sp. RU38E]SNT00385.1 Transposase DDE domain group 1 [Azospirillum sp. RU37A]
MLHTGAYWLMWWLRSLMPRRSPWRTAQFDTLRLRLLKIAARIVEMKTRLRVHLPTACTVQPLLLAMVPTRTTRLVT